MEKTDFYIEKSYVNRDENSRFTEEYAWISPFNRKFKLTEGNSFWG